MGACACRQLCNGQKTRPDVHSERNDESNESQNLNQSGRPSSSQSSLAEHSCLPSTLSSFSFGRAALRLIFETNTRSSFRVGLRRAYIDRMVLGTLKEIRTLLDNDQEPPRSMINLAMITEKENGWFVVINSIVTMIPLSEPLGPAVILLLLEDWSLPTAASIRKLSQMVLDINKNHLKRNARQVCNCGGRLDEYAFVKCCSHVASCTIHRNFCIVLACLAEKLAGPNSITLLSDVILNYLVSNLNADTNGNIILFALIALEKFAQTSENKQKILKKIDEKPEDNPFLVLETWFDDDDFLRHQIGFCAQWCLDNLFLVEGRLLSYQSFKNQNLNALLNGNDVSEYLKISSTGLYARCDASSFESVRCTFQMDEGCWFFECTLITSGVMQLGIATRNSKFLSDEGYGVGDDEYSASYDGCRGLMWFNAKSTSIADQHPAWKVGDILGCLIDLDHNELIFSLNGQALRPHTELFKHVRNGGLFAAASFMSFQECKFNFGASPFIYPPSDRSFKKFNDQAQLTDEQRRIYPKHIRLQNMQITSLNDDFCTLCYDRPGVICLWPCKHDGFCMICAAQIDFCPLCRNRIERREEIKIESDNEEDGEIEGNSKKTKSRKNQSTIALPKVEPESDVSCTHENQ